MPKATSTTYSFKDLNGAFVHPLLATFILAGGNVGLGKVVVTMLTDQSAIDTAADGTVMPSALSGDSASLEVHVQQTSALHKFFLLWFNTVKTLKDSGDVSQWAAAAIALRNTLDGSQHNATGVMPTKIPPKSYEAQGQMIVWTLLACNCVNA